jgi:hypothetical protein
MHLDFLETSVFSWSSSTFCGPKFILQENMLSLLPSCQWHMLKLGFSRAFDSVSCPFLFEVLNCIGFGD